MVQADRKLFKMAKLFADVDVFVCFPAFIYILLRWRVLKWREKLLPHLFSFIKPASKGIFFSPLVKLMSVPLPDPSDSSIFSPSNQAADESSEEASFYEILPCCARFRCGELIAEGQWHHLVLVMSKGMLKNSMATLYLDGQLVSTVKVRRSTAHTE